MRNNKLFLVFFSLLLNSNLFSQSENAIYEGGLDRLHKDLSEPIINALVEKDKYGYFFLLFEIEFVKSKISKINLLNRDHSASFIEIKNILKATEMKWRVSHKRKKVIVFPIIIYDLRGECFTDKPMSEWFSGDQFNKIDIKHGVFIPPLVIGYSKPIK